MCKKFRSTGNKIRLMATTSNPTRAKKPIQPDKKRNLTSKLITIITQNYNKRAERYAPAALKEILNKAKTKNEKKKEKVKKTMLDIDNYLQDIVICRKADKITYLWRVLQYVVQISKKGRDLKLKTKEYLITLKEMLNGGGIKKRKLSLAILSILLQDKDNMEAFLEQIGSPYVNGPVIMNLPRINRSSEVLVKRMTNIHKYFYSSYKPDQYFWVMRLETGNIITRGINLISKFILTEDYNLLMDPKNSKSMFGFFASQFPNLQQISGKSLFFDSDGVIEEKSTEISFRNENELAALAPKNFYQNLLMQFKSNQRDNGATPGEDNRRYAFFDKRRMRARVKPNEVERKNRHRDNIKKKFDLYYRESRRKSAPKNQMTRKKFLSFDEKHKQVPSVLEFDKLKLKRKRMNSISGYKFHPARFNSTTKKSNQNVKKTLRKRTPSKKLTDDFFRKFSKTLELKEKAKQKQESRLKDVLLQSSLKNKHDSYFIPLYKKQKQQKVQKKMQKSGLTSMERKRIRSKSRRRMKSFGNSRIKNDESRRYRSNKRNRRGKSFANANVISDYG